MISRKELQLLLLIILFALVLLALLLLVFSPDGEQTGVPPATPVVESPGREAPSNREVPPPEIVVDELLTRPELIPYEGTLGGTMGFYSEENIQVLNDQWVFARFEDGHVQGSMLLEYTFGVDGELRWTVLAAKMR